MSWPLGFSMSGSGDASLGVAPVEAYPPIIGNEQVKISVNSGSQDYNSWPSLCAFSGDLYCAWARGESHGYSGSYVAETMVAVSTDGLTGRTWGTPAIKVANDGSHDNRDPHLTAFGASYIIMTVGKINWSQNASCFTEVHKTQDGSSWSKIGQINATDAGGSTWTRAFCSDKIHVLPSGRWIVGGFESNSNTPTDVVHRAVVWYSDDEGVNWDLLSVVMHERYQTPSNPQPDETTRNCNETVLVPVGSAFVALVRDNPKVGTTKLWRLISFDGGQTWSNPINVTPSEYAACKPTSLYLADGRLLMTSRLNRASWPSRGMIQLSGTVGASWDIALTMPSLYQEYEYPLLASTGYVVVATGRDTDAGQTASDIWVSTLDVNLTGLATHPVLSGNVDVEFDADECSADGNGDFNGYTGSVWTSSKAPHIGTGILNRQTIEIENYENVVHGSTGDFNYVHNGGAFTIGVAFKILTVGTAANSYLIGTARATTSQVGFVIFFSPVDSQFSRLKLYIVNGSSAVVDSAAATPFPMSEWNHVVVVGNGSTSYKIFINGVLWSTLGYGSGHSGSNHTYPLFLGHDPGTLSADEYEIRRAVIYNVAATDDQAIQVGRWLRR